MSKVQEYSGTVYLGLIDPATGNFLGYLPPLECSAFSPSRGEPTTLEVKSKKRGMKGQPIYSRSTPGAPALEMTFAEMDSTIFGLAFAAAPEALTVSASSFTAQDVVIRTLDNWFALPQRTILASPAPVVTNTGATTTYVAGTDYDIDLRLGLIRAKSSGAITAGQTVKVSASFGAFSGEKYEGELVPQRTFQVLFDGINEVTKKDLLVFYHSVPIAAPQEIFDFLSDELISLTLTGSPITPAGKTSPYTIIRQS